MSVPPLAIAPVPPPPSATSPGVAISMRGNRRRDTAPELALRSALYARGWRYRVDFRIDTGAGVRARPDVVFTRRRVAIFIDGCFWHGCPVHGSQPAQNRSYWGPKLDANRRRDVAQTRALTDDGWCVIRLWEHEPLIKAIETVESVLRAQHK